jgi:hypothetical protein
MSYGSAAGVASFAKTWTKGGVFLDPDAYQDGTPTTLTEVETWLEEVSQLVNVAFENEGFVTPVTVEAVMSAINAKVNSMVADLVHLSHNQGRFYSDRIQESGKSSEDILESEIAAWVSKKANGFEAMGVPRRVQRGSQQAFSVPMARQK